MASVDQKTFDGLDEDTAKYLSVFLTVEGDIAPEDFAELSRRISQMSKEDKNRVLSGLQQEHKTPINDVPLHITMPGVPLARRKRMGSAPELDKVPGLSVLYSRHNNVESGNNPTEYTPQELILFDELGQRVGGDGIVVSHEANGAIIDDALNSGGIVFTRKDIPEVAETIGLKKDGSQDETTDVAEEDLAILTGEYQPPSNQEPLNDVSPLQKGITSEAPKAPEISEISDEFSLVEPVAKEPEPEIEVSSVTPVKSVEKVVLEKETEDPLVADDDASLKLHERLTEANQEAPKLPESVYLEEKDENSVSAGKIPDFLDPRIQVDEPAVATEPQVHAAEGVDAGIISDQADGGHTSKIEASEPEVAPSIENNQIADDTITKANSQKSEPNQVEIHPAVGATSEQVLSDSVVDETAEAEPQKTQEVLAQTTETSNNMQPQSEVAQTEPIQTVDQGSENIVQAETASDGGEGETQTRVIDQEAVQPEQVTKGELSQNTGNVEDVEPASGVLNDPNIFADTNNNLKRTSAGFLGSLAKRFLHGNKKGIEIMQAAREKDGDLNAAMFANKGHHAKTEQEVLEKAA